MSGFHSIYIEIGGERMSLGIKQAMQSKGVSIEAIASLLKVHRNSASNKVNGETLFNIDEALTLQKNLFAEYTVDYLFTDSQK